MNWKIFGVKYDKQETWAFEQMSYLLFAQSSIIALDYFDTKIKQELRQNQLKKTENITVFNPNTTLTQLRTTRTTLLIQSKKQSPKTNN